MSSQLTAPASGGSVRQTGRLAWKDANGNVYGTVEAGRTTAIKTPPSLRVSKTAELSDDRDGNGRPSVGDELEYTVIAENTGTGALSDVEITDPLAARLDVVSSSPQVSSGSVSVETDESMLQRIVANVGTIAGSGSVSLRFKTVVRPTAPVATRPAVVDNQAIVTSAELQPQTSNDPTTPEAGDPTQTTIYPSKASLAIQHTATLLEDADGDGVPSPGDTIRYRYGLENRGDRTATGVVLRAPSGSYLTLVPGSLTAATGSARIADGVATVAVDQLAPAQVVAISVQARIDEVLPLGVTQVRNQAFAAADEALTAESTPVVTNLSVDPRLTMEKTAELKTDRDGNGAISGGDVVSYKVVVRNPSTVLGRGVVVTDELDSSTDLVAGTPHVTQGTVAASGRKLTATLGDIAGGASATLTYDVTVGALAAGEHTLESQASATSPNLGTVRSDDPDGDGSQDSTVVPVVTTPALPPNLSGSKRFWLAVDANGDGKPSPGDTVGYESTITNDGPGGASGVVANDTVDPNTALIAGSVESPTGGIVEVGNAAVDTAVRVRIGSLAAGATASFTYRVRINGTLPSGTSTIGAPGAVSSNEAGSVKTGTGAQTAVDLPEVAAPDLTILTPRDGATVTAQTMVTGDIVAPAGQAIDRWCLTAERVGGEQKRTIKCADGAPAGRDLATFDPTVLPNGTYVLELNAFATGGGEGYVRSTVTVEGALKPGRFVTSYTDMDLPIQALPIRVTRSYDSFDKERGDFGIGWRVGLDGFRISVNRPLGDQGWTHRESDCRFLLGERFCTSTEFEDLSSHTATVTWPDGRAETFDFTPRARVGGVVVGGDAAFTGRKGSTSSLKVAGDQTVTYLGTGELFSDEGSTIFDPQRFELKSKDGTRYLLDTKDGLVSSNDPHGNTLEVSDRGIRSSLGTNVDFTRDAQNRITRIDGPSGELRKYEYSAAGDLVKVTNSLDHSVRFEYDADHNLTKTIDPSGRPTRIVEYDDAGRISKVTDAAGNSAELDVSADGRQQSAVSPDGRLTTVTTSDERGNVTRLDKVHDGQTRTTRYEFDADDRLVKEINPLGQATTSVFDEAGNKVAMTDAAGNTTRNEFDAEGRVVKTTAPDGGTTRMVRDAFGAVTKVIDPLGREQRFEYDARGNQTAQIDALGRTVRTEYNTAGNPTTVKDASGAEATSAYDPSGNLTSLAAAGLGTTQLQYDDEGQLKALIDAAGNPTRYSYDPLGRRIGVTDQLGRTTVTEYDALGRKTKSTDRSSVATTYAYDAMSRLTEKRVGDEVTTYGYDGGGRLKTAENGDARVATAFDAADHPTRFSTTLAGASSAEVVDYGYDFAGRRASMTYGGVTDSYGYDAAGRLSQLTSSQSGAFRFAYDELGRKASLQRPNGVSTSYSYDVTGQIAAIVHAKGGQTLDESRYTYDAAGRRTVVKQFDGDHAYGYDQAGRVTSADHPGSQADESFEYDELGNRINGGEQYDAANKLLSRTGFTYAYDAEGRTTARTETATGKITRFSWDDQSRLRSVTLPDGSVTRYRYDPMGRKIETTRSGQSRVQVYGLDPNAVAETTGSGPSTRYTFGAGYDTPLAMQRSGASTYFAQDALSSVTSTTDQAGTVSGRYRYDTYGQIAGTSGNADSPYTFTGREYDQLAHVYDYRARPYDQQTGRFLAEDPLPAANPYVYASGPPTSLIDPTGQTSSLAEVEETTLLSDVLTAVKWGGGIGATVSLKHGLQCGEQGMKLLDTVVTGGAKGALTGGVGRAVFAGWQGLEKLELASGLAAKLLSATAAVYGTLIMGLAYDAAADSPHLWDDPNLWDLGLALANYAGRVNATAGRAGTAEETDGKKSDQGC